MINANADSGGGAPLPPYMAPPSLPPGVTQAQIDASNAANPNAAGSNGSLFTYQGPPPASSINVGGDPTQAMYADPGYQSLLASTHSNEDAFSAQMRAALQRSAIQSGYNIPEFSPFLDAGMSDQIANNPYSQAALASASHQRNLHSIQNALAARGGYNSGELPFNVGNEEQRFNVEGLNNRGALLDHLDSLLGQQTSMKQQDAAALAEALGQAAVNQSQLHPVTTATYDSATGSYVDPFGNHYDQNGTPITPTGHA